MKRFFIVLAVVSIVGIHVAHAQKMQKGMSLLHAGFGFVPGWSLNAAYDFGIVDAWRPGIFTAGGYVGFANWRHTYKTYSEHPDDYRVNAFAFAPRVSYRYAVNPSFEVFGTAMLGAIFHSYSKHIDNRSDVYYATTVGCRYSFANNISVFAEIGFNEISYLNGGLCFSF